MTSLNVKDSEVDFRIVLLFKKNSLRIPLIVQFQYTKVMRIDHQHGTKEGAKYKRKTLYGVVRICAYGSVNAIKE